MASRITMVKMIGTSPRIRCGSSRDVKILHFLVSFHATCTFTRHNFVNMNNDHCSLIYLLWHWIQMISPFLSQRCTTSSSSIQPFRLFPLFPCCPFNLECRIRACTSVYPLSRLAIFLQNNHKKKWFNQPADMAYKSFLFWFTFTWLWTSYRERLNSFKNTWCAFSLWHL